MAQQKKTPSLQDILKRRQRSDFVGREEQITLFRRNLALPLDDHHRRFIFNVAGQGGVGKTWLLRRFRQIVENDSAITSWTDEAEDDVPEVMGRIAEQLGDQGHGLETFSERYRKYREKRQELEADPEAPQGFPVFVGRTLAKTGIRLARRTPIGGVAFDFVDEDAFATQVGEWTTYVTRKLTNKDEVRLVLEPIQVLTPLFLKDLREVAEEHTVALFFDTYERTGGFLDTWLRELLEGRYGEAPANIVLTIAGRHELDKDRWSPFEGLIARLPLDPFTEEEALDYLNRQRVTNKKVVDVILKLSGRLPLLVATLATESPDDPDEVGDPSGEAVERFLKWVDDPQRRRVALDAALPRRLNRDVLAVLVEEEEANTLFDWLKEMPFVEERTRGWVYHSVVREPMLRHKRRESPQGWAALHGRLADYYEQLQDDLGLDSKKGRRDATWQNYALEALYHRLCQAPRKRLHGALTAFLPAFAVHREFAFRWTDVLIQAGRDSENTTVEQWGEKLAPGVRAHIEDCHSKAIAMFTELLGYSELNKESRWVALQYRGLAQLILENHAEALADFDHAIELEPDDASLATLRSETLHRMNRHDEALAESDRAIGLQPDSAFTFYVRGKCYRDKGEYGRALRDFSRAIELSPADASLIGARGLLLRGLERYEDALADFDRALELDPDLPWVLSSRGAIHKQAGRYDDALIDFRRALELDPDHLWNIAEMAEIYWLTGQYEEALAELEHVEELPPDDPATAVVLVQQVHILMSRDDSVEVNQTIDRLEDCLAFLPSSIIQREWSSIPPAFRDRLGVRSGGFKASVKDWLALIKWLTSEENWEATAMIRHSIIVSLMVDKNLTNARPDQALINCNRGLEASPDNPAIIALRARIYRRMESYDQSLADLDQAIEMVPTFDRYLYEKALTLKAQGQQQKGNAVLEQAISRVRQRHVKDPQNWHTAFDLALCYLASGDTRKAESVVEHALSDEVHAAFVFSAIGDLEDFLVLFPTNSDARALLKRLETHLEETNP